MVTLKRTVTWLLERLLEAIVLGALFDYLIEADLVHRSFTNLRSDVWAAGVIVAYMLFLHGYYATTAICAVFWRSPKLWVYPAITAALFAVHTHIIFLHAGSDFRQQVRAMELPFVGVGVLIVFLSSFGGNAVLIRWASLRRSSNPYISPTVLTLLLFLFSNLANYLRPVIGSSSFRPYGLPFTFYREGGYIREWVWRDGAFVWRGLLADIGIMAAIVALVGNISKRVRVAQHSGSKN